MKGLNMEVYLHLRDYCCWSKVQEDEFEEL